VSPAADEWFVPWRSAPAPRLRLICLGHAGSGAAPFREWAELMPDEVELWALRLPGRENRLDEPPIGDLSRVVAEVADAISSLETPSYALFGHCSGAIVMFEVARELERRRTAGLERLVVSSQDPPALVRTDTPMSADIRTLVTSFGGIDAELVENDELLGILEPRIRADLRLVGEYRYRPARPLRVPVSVIRPAGDVRRAEVQAGWARETEGDCDLVVASGDHLFSGEAWTELGRAVVECLRDGG
jgi:surfactin synthase thioesterase subunit